MRTLRGLSLLLVGGVSRPAGSADFDGTALLALSDVDMVGTAYADGILKPLAGTSDTLSVIDLADPEMSVATIPAPNSVMSWPQVVETSPDGQRAYVVEARSSPPDSVSAYDDIEEMPFGSMLSIFDLTDPRTPSVLQQLAVGTNPRSISVSPGGAWLLTSSDVVGGEVVVLDASDPLHGQWSLPLPGEMTPRALRWRDDDGVFAANLDDTHVGFFRVVFSASGEPAGIEPIGEPIEAGRHLSSGEFIGDGAFFLIPDLRWGGSPAGYLFNGAGRLVSIRFDAGGAHDVVSQARVERSPEGMAVGPDERFAVTVNMRRTYLPDGGVTGVWPGQDRSSLSLLRVDRGSGEVEEIDTVRFDGILPEDAVFDVDGDALAVTLFHLREDLPEQGYIEFWGIDRGAGRLIATGERIPVTRGPHDLHLIP
ncbi:MAG: hypothetical protein AAFV53_29595 [Myxococcota bacterium]